MQYKLLNISKYFNLEIPIYAKITSLLYVYPYNKVNE